MAMAFKRTAAAGSMLSVLIAMGLVSTPSHAVDLRKGAAASIPSTETIDDTVVAVGAEKNQSIDIAGTVKGDVFAGGDVVTISGTVEGNLFVIARRVEVHGTVGGTLFGLGHTVVISGRVGRNLITASDNVNVERMAEVLGNSITASRDATIDGTIQKDLLSAAAILDLRGNVSRNVRFAGGQVSLTGSSRVGGNLNAHVDKEEGVRVAQGAIIAGQTNIKLPVATPRSSRYLTVRFYVWQFIRILTMFVTGLLLFKLVPGLVPARFISGTDWLKAGGVGFMTLVAVPIAAIIVAVTVIGLPIAIVSVVLYLIACYLAKIIVAEFVGRSVMKTSGAVSLLAGLLLVIVAVNLPWIGSLINFVLILLGLGAIALTAYNNVVYRRTAEI
jgi:cytoskeletal protein CcmA (bactofilin family)